VLRLDPAALGAPPGQPLGLRDEVTGETMRWSGTVEVCLDPAVAVARVLAVQLP
jgi:hypothetical protein